MLSKYDLVDFHESDLTRKILLWRHWSSIEWKVTYCFLITCLIAFSRSNP